MTPIEIAQLAALLAPAAAATLAWYRATLTQGWKRQLRRMFGAVGAPVDRLVRVRIGPVRHRRSAQRPRSAPLKAPEVRGLGAPVAPARAGRRRTGATLAVATGAILAAVTDWPDATISSWRSTARVRRARAASARPRRASSATASSTRACCTAR